MERYLYLRNRNCTYLDCGIVQVSDDYWISGGPRNIEPTPAEDFASSDGDAFILSDKPLTELPTVFSTLYACLEDEDLLSWRKAVRLNR